MKTVLIRRFVPALAGGFLFISHPVVAADDIPRLDLKPGNWEISKQIESKKDLKPWKTTKCLENGDPIPELIGGPCQATERVREGDKLTWKTVCQEHKGAVVGGTGEITGKDSSFTGKTSIEIVAGDKKIPVNTTWSGKYLGECPKEEAAPAKDGEAAEKK